MAHVELQTEGALREPSGEHILQEINGWTVSDGKLVMVTAI